MSFKFIAISLLSIGLAGSAMAQTAGGVNSNGRLSVAPIIGGSGSSGAGSAGTGSARTGSVGTDPGITNSTTGNGGVDLDSGRSTINPGGVNPELRSTPGCAGASGTNADAGSIGDACPQ